MPDVQFTVCALADLADKNAPIVYGIVQPGEHLPSGVPFVQSRDVGREINVRNLQCTAPDIAAAYRRSTVRAGDILFSLRGEIGQSSLASKALTGANIARGIARIRIASQHNAEFVRYALRSPTLIQQIARDANGSTFKELTIDALRKLPIPVPPLPAQRKIAEILRTWDEAIEKLEALVDLKLAQRERLRCWLIVKSEREGRAAYFSEFLSESREPGTDGATAQKITVRLYGKGAVEKSEHVKGSTNTRYYRRRAGQLIYSKLDFLNGAFALIPEELDGFQSTLDLPCFDISEIANPRWVLEYLTRPSFYSQQSHLARGQRKARRVAPDDLLAAPLRFPSRAAQDKIVEILIGADREMALERQALHLLNQQQRGLMQKLLTGEWRVRP
jgi:type I restriction enzyme S subunit